MLKRGQSDHFSAHWTRQLFVIFWIFATLQRGTHVVVVVEAGLGFVALMSWYHYEEEEEEGVIHGLNSY